MTAMRTELETLIGLRGMQKRVWIPGEKRGEFVEMRDGAVPMWYIERRIQQLIDDQLIKTSGLRKNVDDPY